MQRFFIKLREDQVATGIEEGDLLSGWAPDPDDAESSKTFATAINTLVRLGKKGCTPLPDLMEHQHPHTDCPPEGLGPHLNIEGKEVVFTASPVHVDSREMISRFVATFRLTLTRRSRRSDRNRQEALRALGARQQ